jgi:hypothetical protein
MPSTKRVSASPLQEFSPEEDHSVYVPPKRIMVTHSRAKTCAPLKELMLEEISVKNLPYPLLMNLCVFLEVRCPEQFASLNGHGSLGDGARSVLADCISTFLCGAVPSSDSDDQTVFVQAMKRAALLKGFTFNNEEWEEVEYTFL